MRSFGLVLLPLAVKLASAQQTYHIDPESVSSQTRDIWCNNQQAACPLICLQTSARSSDTESNDCDPDTLDFSCVCSNGISPNASEYSQTIPFYLCQETGNQCVNACTQGDTNCQSNCRAQHPCGAQNPIKVNVTMTSSSASATGSSTRGSGGQSTNSAGQTIYNGLGGAAAATTGSGGSQTGSAAALNLGQAYGVFAVAAGIFGGFAFLL